MRLFFWRRAAAGAVLSDNRGGPWGPGGGSGGNGNDSDGPRSPWDRPSPRKPGRPLEGGAFEDFLRRSRERFGGKLPGSGRPYWIYAIGAFLALWIIFTSMHRIGPQERGVVTIFGRYSGVMQPGIGLSWPSPISRVQVIDVEAIRTISIPGSNG
jgi:membrane protease subunit HflK